ncbi:hypothetical protein EC844_105132 [Acinetobacter calcoaceticus]|uniref:Uncharacterized protein n=1 Tax=Acinetobacter calcoaceticus TaxID=471 RepID=A0A4V2R1G7_ACICA|nr:hypothetical protein EC844_105132 [Acinetobacter calcoaceticus]
MKIRMLFTFLILATVTSTAIARNYPCSGKKGGVSHCEGTKYVCKDKSYSASKYPCQ